MKTETKTKTVSKPRPIKAGDVVALKSGSQKMTVTACSTTHGIATVVWQHFETKDIKVSGIPLTALTHAI
jgi:uncharacterized protein YodC (DUF2158 family)